MNLNNLRTGKRLALGFGIVTTLLLLLTAAAWWQLTTINQTMDVALVQNEKMATLLEIDSTLDTIYLEIWALVTAKDDAIKLARKTAIDRHRQAYTKELENLKSLAKSQEDKDLLARLEEAVDGAKTLNLRVTEMARLLEILSRAS